MSDLKEFKNTMAKGIFGMTVDEAHEKGICIDCNEPALPKCYSPAGKREYQISGMCEQCFDKMFDGGI
jgi:hypothetical protein